jgi:hypothetical protein
VLMVSGGPHATLPIEYSIERVDDADFDVTIKVNNIAVVTAGLKFNFTVFNSGA